MNAKKPPKRRRAVSKVNPKVEKGNLHHINKIIGKSKTIGAKRVTLLPGFLINGFTSGTVKRARGKPTHKPQTKDHLLTENLQAFLEQKSHNLRRSQRIIEKYTDEQPFSKSTSENNSEYGHHQDVDMRSPMPNSCIKSILKKNPKSIFKQISDKFSKVQNERFRREDQSSNLLTRFEKNFSDGSHQQLEYNKDVGEDFKSRLQVTFRKNILGECQQNIKKQITWTNAALAGRVHHQPKNDGSLYLLSENNSEEPYEKITPIPRKKWVYVTPGTQKVRVPATPAASRNPLKPAVICQQELYEFPPGCEINYATPQNVPVDNNVFLRRVAGMKGTPTVPFRGAPGNGCFEQFRYPSGHRQVQNGVVVMPIQNPTYVDYRLVQNRVLAPPPPPPPLQDFCEQLDDLTFVDVGNDNFQPRATQMAYNTNNNRNDCDVLEDPNKWTHQPDNNNTGNLFDFSRSQETNLFHFGVI